MLLTLSIISGLVRGEEFLDVVSGSSVTLKCRFDPQLNQRRSTLYWIRSNRINHDNVAIGETAFHQDYRSVYIINQAGEVLLGKTFSMQLCDQPRFKILANFLRRIDLINMSSKYFL